MHTIFNIIVLYCLTLLSSCVINQNYAPENSAEESLTRSISSGEDGWLQVTIRNDAPNTILQIDSLVLNNTLTESRIILFHPSAPVELHFGSETIVPKTKMAEQKLSHWLPLELPSETNETYLTIYGQIIYSSSNNPSAETTATGSYIICAAPMYTALPATIQPNQTSQTTLSLYPNCPIFTLTNGTLVKVLQEIGFAPYVVPYNTVGYEAIVLNTNN